MDSEISKTSLSHEADSLKSGRALTASSYPKDLSVRLTISVASNHYFIILCRRRQNLHPFMRVTDCTFEIKHLIIK